MLCGCARGDFQDERIFRRSRIVMQHIQQSRIPSIGRPIEFLGLARELIVCIHNQNPPTGGPRRDVHPIHVAPAARVLNHRKVFVLRIIEFRVERKPPPRVHTQYVFHVFWMHCFGHPVVIHGPPFIRPSRGVEDRK